MSKLKLLFIAFEMGRYLIDYVKANSPNERNNLNEFFREWESSTLKENDGE